MSNIKFSTIKEILKDAKRGKMFVLVDDEGRENEGDIIIPASKQISKSIKSLDKKVKKAIDDAYNLSLIHI